VGPETAPDESPRHGYRGAGSAHPARPEIPAGLTIAVSREAGARGGTIGRRVGRKLGWQVYDQELLEYLIQEGTAQQALVEGLTEQARAWVESQLKGLLEGRRLEVNPPMVAFARLGLALGAAGQVVLIGRGAGFVLPRETTLHVRLVAPYGDRVAYMSQCLRLTHEEARERVRVRDALRAEYLASFLHRQPSDLTEYDMVLNTSSLGEDLCTELVVQAARAKGMVQFESEEGGEPGG
jgi:hypothetical protein